MTFFFNFYFNNLWGISVETFSELKKPKPPGAKSKPGSPLANGELSLSLERLWGLLATPRAAVFKQRRGLRPCRREVKKPG